MTKTTVLIIDDDEHMLMMLTVLIESAGYQVIKAQDGVQALRLLEGQKVQPDAILSDVEMPELDGYGLCTRLRALDSYKEVPFIFVSGKTTLEEKLKGYDVGGDEYITKPLEGEEVVRKVRNIIENRIQHRVLTERLHDSQNAAMQAMSYSSNLGQVLQFIKSTSQVNEYEVLADRIFETVDTLGVSVVVQFIVPEGLINYKKGGTVTPLEANVIELSRTKGRIFDFQARSIFSFSHFSMLVLNMPNKDKEKYGMMKDVMSNLCEAIDSKIALLSSNAAVRQKDSILDTVTYALENIEQSHKDIQVANMQAIDEMLLRMEEAMFGFGLSESQEDTVRGIIMYAKKKISEVHEDGAELHHEIEKIHNSLVKGL